MWASWRGCDLQFGTSQAWLCPNGHLDGHTFVIVDGRHE